MFPVVVESVATDSGEVDLHDAVAFPCCGKDGHPLDGLGINRAMDVISPTQRLGVAMMGKRAYLLIG